MGSFVDYPAGYFPSLLQPLIASAPHCPSWSYNFVRSFGFGDAGQLFNSKHESNCLEFCVMRHNIVVSLQRLHQGFGIQQSLQVVHSRETFIRKQAASLSSPKAQNYSISLYISFLSHRGASRRHGLTPCTPTNLFPHVLACKATFSDFLHSDLTNQTNLDPMECGSHQNSPHGPGQGSGHDFHQEKNAFSFQSSQELPRTGPCSD